MAGAIALYMRISLDDERHDESDSISNQRDLLRAYVAADPALSDGEVLEFMDDGWSGTNFSRPRVQELLELARRGVVKCIVVKDLSRWGRNYPDVNEYLDKIFPFLGVRFISVNDHFDSNDHRGATAPIDVAFNSIMHDIYSKELSVKIRQSYVAKASKGEFVCGSAPFGYLRSDEVKNKIVIDEGAAAIVRRVFDMACDGMNCVQIAGVLNEEGIDTAAVWHHRNGRSSRNTTFNNEGRTHWSGTQIQRMIRNENYTGTQVSFKYRRTKLGHKNQFLQPESEWLKIPEAHEPIIPAELFAEANARIRRNKQTRKGVAENRSPFTSKIFCGCCDRAMLYMGCKAPYHYCKGVKLKRGLGCYDGKVYYANLSEAVLAAVQAEARKVFDEIQKRKETVRLGSADKDAAFDERKRLMAKVSLMERRGDALYEDYADGRLDKEGYLASKAVIAEELAVVEARIAEMTSRLEDFAETVVQPNNEPLLRRVLDAGAVTDEVLSLVDCIMVYDPSRIEVRFAFSDTNAVGA